MKQQVETNTYLMEDADIAKNIVSDCKLPYGQAQIFKGVLFKFNRNFDPQFLQSYAKKSKNAAVSLRQLNRPPKF